MAKKSSGKKKSAKKTNKKPGKSAVRDFAKDLDNLSTQELKELLMVNTYKLALVRSQVEALSEIMIKHKFTTYEEIWKKTNESFKQSTL